MTQPSSRIKALAAQIATLQAHTLSGQVVEVSGGLIHADGLARVATLGDRVAITSAHPGARPGPLYAEVLKLAEDRVALLPEGPPDGIGLGAKVQHLGQAALRPDASWLGHVLDGFGQRLDGRRLAAGAVAYPLCPPVAPAMDRRGLGARLSTGLSAFDTFLPLVRGQRLGLFAGAGVGKSTLLASLARNVSADVTVIALIGERGREVRHFVDRVLGPDGMKRAIVVAATSDQHPLVKRRAAWVAMTVAEYFRDLGAQVLFLADSITRLADAHREIAVQSGEAASLRGYPASTGPLIMSLCERAGPGGDGQGDISALLSVLVAGSDMDEPIADMMRGILDGHVVLSREIAERGRFPAIDVLQSVSRSLPEAATEAETRLLQQARQDLARYEQAKLMVQSGLYTKGADADLDKALDRFAALDGFLGGVSPNGIDDAFRRLAACLGMAPPQS